MPLKEYFDSKEIKEVMAEAARMKELYNRKTILFVDEVHRFNKAQQDAFLPHVEKGNIILIGATTENPSFEVISALLSRTRVYTLNPLKEEELKIIVNRALEEIWVFINSVNKYLADNEPWRLAKDEEQKKRLGRILYQTAAAIQGISYLLFPVMPESSEKIWDSLGEKSPIEEVSFSELKFEDFKLDQKIKVSKPLFPRVSLKEFLQEEAPHLEKRKKEEKMDYISFDEFKKWT